MPLSQEWRLQALGTCRQWERALIVRYHHVGGFPGISSKFLKPRGGIGKGGDTLPLIIILTTDNKVAYRIALQDSLTADTNDSMRCIIILNRSNCMYTVIYIDCAHAHAHTERHAGNI